MTRTAAQVRQEFLDFFRQRGHTIVPSSPVVPLDDPTLLFANAGMNQFKPYFLGLETPKFPRAADTQKCIRAGGKHNDLDDVGHDTYHHTFFEMLGNWSFGDYFKKEAIAWAWELLVDVWGIDPTRLHATYFRGDPAEGLEPDLEARDLWRQILPAERVHPGSKKDNFWEMGETGPCGPCSEIHIDLTPDKSGAKLVNAGDARVIEIWNLVFIQFNRAADGQLTPLPAKHVDTGMGFERVTAVLQGHNNNYATDVFVPIIQAIEKISGHKYGVSQKSEVRSEKSGAGASEPEAEARGTASNFILHTSDLRRYAAFIPGDMRDESCRVIADHIRCLTFAITDGATPDKEGRGYVLRRILRRAVRYGWQYLNLHEPFLYKLVPTVVEVMGEAFPELRKNPEHVQGMIHEEEEAFASTFERGLSLWWSHAGWAFYERIIQENALGPGKGAGRGITLFTSRPRHAGLFEPDPDSMGPDTIVHIQAIGAAGADLCRFRLAELNAEHVTRYCDDPPAISGAAAFELHDTYGFPIDLTELMAKERGLRVDFGEYERLMEQARERARAVKGTVAPFLDATLVAHHGPTEFLGYSTLRVDDALVLRAFTVDGVERASGLQTGESGVLILDKTPFYAEAGGQVGDRGIIRGTDGEPWEFAVEDTGKIAETYVHFGRCIRGPIQKTVYSGFRAGSPVPPGEAMPASGPTRLVRAVASVEESARRDTMKNHTATHVMNWALREVLGEHVQQKGSLVDHEKTRFDFSHPKPLTPEEIKHVERLVNECVRANLLVDIKDDAVLQDALKINGLRAVFGERYPDRVRVMAVGVKIEDLIKQPDNPEWRKYSIEFCGGTHLNNTRDIEHFTITTEEAVAKGIRRIVAVTGETARKVEQAGDALVQRAEQLKRGPADAVAAGLAELQSTLATETIPLRQRHRLRELTTELQAIVKQQQKSQAADAAEVVKRAVAALLERAEKIATTTVVVGEMPDVPIEQLKMGADQIKQKCGSAAVLFGVRVAPESEPEAAATGESEREAPASADVASAPRGRRGSADTADGRRRPRGGDATTDRLKTGPTSAGKALLLAALTPDLVKKGLKAGDLVKAIAPLIAGGGGGPPTMAQAGGKQPEKLAEALEAGRKWITARLEPQINQ